MVGCFRALLAALVLVSAAPAHADESGPACITDGQTLSIDGRRSYGKCRGGTEIRLFGIVAPRLDDTCPAPQGRLWQCGRASAAMLLEITRNKTVDCEGKTEDSEGRLLATCYAGGQETNYWMVREGWALANPAHTLKYREAEKLAERERKGLWQSPPGVTFDWKGR